MDMKATFGLNLPEQVPYLGFEEPYFLGNGVVCVGGFRDGTWDFCTGHSYGYAYNMVKRERLKVYIDGRPYTPRADMRRARKTGILYSVQQFPKAAVALIDFAPRGVDFVARMLAVRNTSDTDIKIHPYVEYKFEGDRNKFEETEHAYHLMHGTKSWMTLQFGGCVTNVRPYTLIMSAEVILDSDDVTLKPGEVRYFTLYHDTRMSELPLAEQSFPDRSAENGVAYLEECIAEWQDWCSRGLDKSQIPDEFCRDVLESCDVFIRMGQGIDGGEIATARVYMGCYVRDSFCAMKGMLALQRFPEVKHYLQFQYGIFQMHIAKGEFGVPNASAIGGYGDGCFFGFGDEEYWSCESPGLMVILAVQYYQATGDLEFLRSIDDFLRYCINVQLKHAEKNDWKMFFNTDETESQGCGILLKEQSTIGCDWWSFTSAVICMKSVELMKVYLEAIGEGKTDLYAEYDAKMHKLIASTEENFWDEKAGIYHWFRKRDGSWPITLIPDFHITPLYMNAPLNRERIESSARNMLPHWNRETGYIPNQVFGENDDFCGHNMGYLLFMAAKLGLKEADAIYESLVHGTSTSAYGMWAEAYYDNGTPYGNPSTFDSRMHNMRTFESGLNVDAIVTYWNTKK